MHHRHYFHPFYLFLAPVILIIAAAKVAFDLAKLAFLGLALIVSVAYSLSTFARKGGKARKG